MLSLGIMLQLLLALHHQHEDLVVLSRVCFGVNSQALLVFLQCFSVLTFVVFTIASDNSSSSYLLRLAMLKFSLFGLRGNQNWSRWCGKKCDSLRDLFCWDRWMRVGLDFAFEDEFSEGEIYQFISSHTHLLNNNIQPNP